MDAKDLTYSTTDAAEWLGVSVPTIHRAISRLKLKPIRGAKGNLRLSEGDLLLLLADLGKAPKMSEFTREELFILNILQKRPFGLRSARLVARHAGISPSTAQKALLNLERQGMVEHRRQIVAEGRVKEIQVWLLCVTPFWMTDELALKLRSIATPLPTQSNQRETHVPQRFKHLFWNTDLRKLNTIDHGPAIAISIIEQDNPHALAWAIRNLDREAFAVAALPRRGFAPRMSALASHIAEKK